MILQAFCEDEWQFYYEAQIKEIVTSDNSKRSYSDCTVIFRDYPLPYQHLSKAIKYPVPTYEKPDGCGYFDYFYYDRQTNSIVRFGNGFGFPGLPGSIKPSV